MEVQGRVELPIFGLQDRRLANLAIEPKPESHTRFELVTYRVLSGRDNQLHQRDVFTCFEEACFWKMCVRSYKYSCRKQKRITTTAGFEPTRAEPNGFRVHRLNRSAKLSEKCIHV